MLRGRAKRDEKLVWKKLHPLWPEPQAPSPFILRGRAKRDEKLVRKKSERNLCRQEVFERPLHRSAVIGCCVS